MKLGAVVADTVPGIVAASTEVIPDINPYLQAVILILSGITAIIRLINASKKKPENP
jgi:hypothetical protein